MTYKFFNSYPSVYGVNEINIHIQKKLFGTNISTIFVETRLGKVRTQFGKIAQEKRPESYATKLVKKEFYT